MPHLRPVREPHHLLDQRLAAVVGRVRLAGDDQLNRAFLVEQEAFQPAGIAQHQCQPLVRRDSPGEADREHIRIERLCNPT